MVKRLSMFAVVGLLSLVVLAACGSEDDEVEPTVTRVPATNAPVVTATAAAEEEEEAAASPVAGSPEASPMGSPVAEVPGSPAASPVATTPEPTTPEPTATTAAAVNAPIVIEMRDIAFAPNEVTIPANTDVVIELPNVGVAPHGFDIDALGIKTEEIPGGGSTSVTINAAPGTYDFYCPVPGHKEAGMVGKLIVQ